MINRFWIFLGETINLYYNCRVQYILKYKMKKYLFIIIVIFTAVNVFSQETVKKNQLGILFSAGDNTLSGEGTELDGGLCYEGTGAYLIGLKYSREITKRIEVESGVNFSQNKIKITPNLMWSIYIPTTYVDLYMFSIPILLKCYFGKVFFVNAGTQVDFETNSNKVKSVDNQSGIGYSIGFGAKFKIINNYFISINPYFKQHARIAFNPETYPQRLAEFGVKLDFNFNF